MLIFDRQVTMDIYLKIKEYFEENLNLMEKKWSTFIMIASVVLYFFGFLSLHSHLYVMGVTPDYQFINGRYLFDGINFLLYIIFCIPPVIPLILLLMCIIYIFRFSNKLFMQITAKLLPKNVQSYIQTKWHNYVSFFFGPLPLLCIIILLIFLFIQIVMRKVLHIVHIPLWKVLPDDSTYGNFLVFLFSHQGKGSSYLFVLLIVTGLAITSWLYFKQIQFTQIKLKILHIVLGVLILIQIILLPISYGIISNKQLQRISKNNSLPLKTTENAWIIWKGNKDIYFLVKDSQTNMTRILLAQKDSLKHLFVEGTDWLFDLVYVSRILKGCNSSDSKTTELSPIFQ